jgi:hypothetical protein
VQALAVPGPDRPRFALTFGLGPMAVGRASVLDHHGRRPANGQLAGDVMDAASLPEAKEPFIQAHCLC